jgi:guanine nucleotide-binding protein G(I)/G(S)/G(T) subunit beta-1
MRAVRDLCDLTSDMLTCAVTGVAFSTSGRLLFAAYEEHNCIVWDVLKGKRISLITGTCRSLLA